MKMNSELSEGESDQSDQSDREIDSDSNSEPEPECEPGSDIEPAPQYQPLHDISKLCLVSFKEMKVLINLFLWTFKVQTNLINCKRNYFAFPVVLYNNEDLKLFKFVNSKVDCIPTVELRYIKTTKFTFNFDIY